jgi:hypothetical protein
LPDEDQYIYDVKISGFTRSSIYIHDRVNNNSRNERLVRYDMAEEKKSSPLPKTGMPARSSPSNSESEPNKDTEWWERQT